MRKILVILFLTNLKLKSILNQEDWVNVLNSTNMYTQQSNYFFLK